VDFDQLQSFRASTWDGQILLALLEYAAIPCESPSFDPDWASHGHMDRAVDLELTTAKRITAAVAQVLRDGSKVPRKSSHETLVAESCEDAVRFPKLSSHCESLP
jgi:hypothetical protein